MMKRSRSTPSRPPSGATQPKSQPNYPRLLRGKRRAARLAAWARFAARLAAWTRFLPPAVFAVVCANALLLLMPWQPRIADLSLDGSWTRAIQEAFLHRWAFGRDVVFTHGPWAFFVRPYYHPSLYAAQLVIQGLLVLLLMACTWRIGRALSQRPVLGAIAGGLLCLAITEIVAQSYEVLYYLLIWQLVVYHYSWEKSAAAQSDLPGKKLPEPPPAASRGGRLLALAPQWHRHALLTTVALLTLTKFSYAAAILVIVVAVAAKTAWQDRRIPWILPLYVLQVLAFWLLAGQRLSDIGPFFQTSFEVSGAYSVSMQWPGPTWHIVCYAAIAAVLLAAVGWQQWRSVKWSAVFPVASFAVVLYVAAKGTFVRHDWWHFIIGSYVLLSVSATTCALLWPTRIGRFAKAMLCSSLVPALVLASPFAYPAPGRPSEAQSDTWGGRLVHAALDPFEQLGAIAGMLGGSRTPKDDFDRVAAAIRFACPIPQVDGTMDLYSYMQHILIAHAARYNPRPILQSYTVYTPHLARMNADHLRGPAAPDCILFGMTPMDGHFPSLEDGLSWPDLCSRYELDPGDLPAPVLEYLVLRRSKEARPCKLVPIAEVTAEMGEPLQVPGTEQGPVWVEMDIKPTLAGKMAGLALKTPIVYTDVQLTNGATGQFTLVPQMAAAGFLLSPIVSDINYFSWLASTPWSDPHWQKFLAERTIRAMTINSTGPWAFHDQVNVRFFRLEFEPAPSPIGAFTERHLSLLQMLSSQLVPRHPTQNSPSLHWIHGQGVALVSPAGTALGMKVSPANRFFSLPKTARHLWVSFGGLATRRGDENQGRVGFRISAFDAAGKGRALWSKVVDAGPYRTKTVVYDEAFPVDLADTETLVFETFNDRPDQSLLPFWHGVKYD